VKVAAIATSCDPDVLRRLVGWCEEALARGADASVFLRDEAILQACRPEVAATLGFIPAADVQQAFQRLAEPEQVRIWACSSSLYLWGVDAAALISAVSAARGLIAFLAEDVSGADAVRAF
jgi:peroxiredoxin family protein